MATQIVFTGKSVGLVEDCGTPEPGEGEVLIETQYSLMSTGTENIVFNRLFEAGSHWDKWVKYPFYPGYANVGVVAKLGPGVKGLKCGEWVASRSRHSSQVVVAEKSCFRIPPGMDPKGATWFALAKISSMGARAAQYTMADNVLIIGAGPIGQMSVRWAHALGLACIICLDPQTKRLTFAQRGGAHLVLSEPLEACLDPILEATGGEGPRVVMDSTGNEKAFGPALSAARRFGRVVILGDTGTPSAQHLNSFVMGKGLTIVAAHDGHEDAHWNAAKIVPYFFNLVLTGRFDLSGLITHEFPFRDAMAAYELANTHRHETMGILFDWTR